MGFNEFVEFLNQMHKQRNVFLVVALLLAVFLFIRVNRRERVKRWPRLTPLDIKSLGRMTFAAARSNNLHEFRQLFLNGAEARKLFNDLAEEYMEKRNAAALQDILHGFNIQIPNGSSYIGPDPNHTKQLVIQIKLADESETLALPIGKETQVDRAWRILEPTGGF